MFDCTGGSVVTSPLSAALCVVGSSSTWDNALCDPQIVVLKKKMSSLSVTLVDIKKEEVINSSVFKLHSHKVLRDLGDQVTFLTAHSVLKNLSFYQGQIENMGTYDELVSSGKEFAMLLSSLEEGKDKDTDSMGSKVSYKIS